MPVKPTIPTLLRATRGIAVLLIVLVATAAVAPRAEEPVLETEDQKTLYMIGVMMAQRIGLAFTPEEVALVSAGLTDALLGREPRVPTAEYAAKIQPMVAARLEAAAEEQRVAGEAFRAKAVEEAGAVELESGVVYTEIAAGDGEMPAADDTVTLHYHGTFYDGKIFDSSRIAGSPATFKLDGVISCFGEALQKMRVGGKSRVICPPSSAYGETGAAPKILPGATLIFEVELLSIAPPQAPADEAGPADTEPDGAGGGAR